MSEDAVLEDVQVESKENDLDALQTEIDEARLELEKTKKELEEKKQELKAIPAGREISQDEKELIERQKAKKGKKSELALKIEKQKAYDNVMVTGKFMNLRVPGQSKKLPYHKYPDDPIKWYNFNHGQVYTIPRGFADQINGGTEQTPCYYMPKFTQKAGDQVLSDQVGENSAIAAVDTSHKMYAFVPVNF
jgi:hypothetical protein